MDQEKTDYSFNRDDALNMIATTKRLSEIIQEEVDLLKKMKVSQLHTLHDEKLSLTSTLEEYKEVFVNNPNAINSIPGEMKRKIRDQALKFESIIEEDGKQLSRVMKIQEIVWGVIQEKSAKQMSSNRGYDKNGNLTYKRNNIANTPPIKIIENI